MTSAFFLPSKDFATVTWNRGHNEGFLRKRLRIMDDKGAKPVVKGSGLSENALRKPTLFICLNMRMMKASVEVATILKHG